MMGLRLPGRRLRQVMVMELPNRGAAPDPCPRRRHAEPPEFAGNRVVGPAGGAEGGDDRREPLRPLKLTESLGAQCERERRVLVRRRFAGCQLEDPADRIVMPSLTSNGRNASAVHLRRDRLCRAALKRETPGSMFSSACIWS